MHAVIVFSGVLLVKAGSRPSRPYPGSPRPVTRGSRGRMRPGRDGAWPEG